MIVNTPSKVQGYCEYTTGAAYKQIEDIYGYISNSDTFETKIEWLALLPGKYYLNVNISNSDAGGTTTIQILINGVADPTTKSRTGTVPGNVYWPIVVGAGDRISIQVKTSNVMTDANIHTADMRGILQQVSRFVAVVDIT